MRVVSTAIMLCVLFAPLSVRADEAPVSAPDEKQVILKGRAFVQEKSLAWPHERKCASCHHLPMMVWVQRDARQRGFPIDETGLKEAQGRSTVHAKCWLEIR